MKENRLISLCNVLYKLISKVLANRIKGVLNEIIAPNQTAFISRRLIIDNIMIAYELLHSMKTRNKGSMGSMAIKLDMPKVYDRIEWPFLEAMLRKLGFRQNFTRLIMECVGSVKYSVLINGRLGKMITPSRGLRQEDPLSPYLFIICAKGFSQLLKAAELRGEIKGVAVARGARV